MPVSILRRAGRPLPFAVVLLLASAAFAAAPTGRYQADADTVFDRATGLTWQRATAPGTYGWEAAKSYCASLSLSGQTWRLPTVRELSTLVDPKVTQPTIELAAFPDTPAGRFWTSTAYAPAAGSAWTVVFSDGGVLHAGVAETHNVRCVR